jgi:hypothetical protein
LIDSIAQQPLGQRHQVRRAGVVALLVEPDRVGVVGVGEAERGGVAVHLGDEARFRAGGGDCEGVGGVVAAAQDQSVEEVADADLLSRPQPHQRLPVFGFVGLGADDLVEWQVLHRHVGGHQLGGAGDRQRFLGGMRDEDVAGAGVDHSP